MSAVSPLPRRIEVGEVLPGCGPCQIAADLYLPPRLRDPPTALFCLPGGGMNRGYFDLQGEGGFSFAEHLCAHGFMVVTLDHLGIGDSTRPADGFELTPHILAAAMARAVAALRQELRAGTSQTPPLGQLYCVGVGHSMGAMLTAIQQAQHGGYDALALFGFSTRGLTVALTPQEARYAFDPAGARDNVVRLARLRGTEPYPPVGRSAQGRELFAGESADRRGVDALQRARAPLLLTAGLFSMIPGSCAPECAQINTPLLLAFGDRDMAGPPHEVPANYGGSPEVTLLVLPQTGHAHFLFPARAHLFRRVTAWCEALQPAG